MTDNPLKQILNGDVRALARLMSLIENRDHKAEVALKALYPHTGRAHVVGVTGAPGTGKSTLIDRMTVEFRRRKKTVGILAVDPSSVFSSGAVLGDRIRMREHFLDDGVFIRSFATRGGSGGLSVAVREAIHLLDAAGKEVIFVETIGVGQDQVEIAALAHTVVVVLIPGMGDEIQGMKAGLTEIADVLAVNKADLAGAEEMVQQLKVLFGDEGFHIVPASSLKNEGIHLLVDTIEEHRRKSLDNGDDQRKRLHLCRHELLSLLREKIFSELAKKLAGDSFERQVKLIVQRQKDPYSVVDEITKRIGM
ncbi:MAG TPA: methylmalonyl Co-A mutase-associated GTPase MeaB [Candidatus Udaeobacter sp.]|jgi:LAO/AO transport system kinase|nr:methylmalonyl Co-A mutase-associated GTPase MeaB [Candidatus Udaeobacter sp.]